MIHPFELDVLLFPGMVIFSATLLVVFWVTRSAAFSIIAAIGKATFFFIYFGALFDGTYTFLDDWTYLAGGAELLAQDVGLTNLVDNWEFALMIGRGDHFIFYLYNTYAFRFFGEGYYAPVALNILLTLPIAWIGARLASREFGFVGVWEKMFFAFLLFQPDIFAWSNVMNCKDVLVLLLHVLLLFSASLFFRRQYRKALFLSIPVIFALFFLRYYVPLLFAVAFAASLLFMQSRRNHLRLLFVGVAIVALASIWLGGSGFEYALAMLQENLLNPFYGFVRFTLTPIPFHTDDNYQFLEIPALIHWMLMPLTVWGMVIMLRQKTPYMRFILLYLLVFIGLYAVSGELQGPRERVQLDFAWAALQFMGLMHYLRIALGLDKRPLSTSALYARM